MIQRFIPVIQVIPVAVALLLGACAAYPPKPSATAQLNPTKGNTVTGTVSFARQPGNVVKVSGEVR